MAGTPLDMATAALQTVTRTFEDVHVGALTTRLADARLMNALDVIGASLEQMTAAEAEVLRARIHSASADVWLTAKDSGALRLWARTYTSRMAAMARGGR